MTDDEIPRLLAEFYIQGRLDALDKLKQTLETASSDFNIPAEKAVFTLPDLIETIHEMQHISESDQLHLEQLIGNDQDKSVH